MLKQGGPRGPAGRLVAMAAKGEIDKCVAEDGAIIVAAELSSFSGNYTGGGPIRRLRRGVNWLISGAVRGDFTFTDVEDKSGLILAVIKMGEASKSPGIVLFKPTASDKPEDLVVDQRMTLPAGTVGLVTEQFGGSHVLTEESAHITAVPAGGGDRTFEITFLRKWIREEMGLAPSIKEQLMTDAGLKQGKAFKLEVATGEDGDKLVAWLADRAKDALDESKAAKEAEK